MLTDLYKLFNFAPDGAPSGAPEDPPETPETPPDDTTTPPEADKTPDKVEPITDTTDDVTLSQKALGSRIDRAKSTGSKEALKGLGFESVEDAEAAFKAGQEAIDAALTEKEKADKDLQALKDQGAVDKTAREAAEQRALDAEMKSEALGMMGIFANPLQAFRLLDLTDVERNDDGTFEGLEAAVKALAKSESWTLATGKNKPNDPLIGETDPPDDETDGKKSESEETKRARYFGGGVKDSGFFDVPEGGGRVKVE